MVTNQTSNEEEEEEELKWIPVWVIDCEEKSMISKLFEFIKSLNFNRIDSINHLKSIKPFPKESERKGSTIFICPTALITYQELTAHLQAQSTLGPLISRSTPYRIKVPYQLSKDPTKSLEWSRIWPLELSRPKPKSSNELNEPMFNKLWSPTEIQHILDRFLSVLNSAYESFKEQEEIGVAVSVTNQPLESIHSLNDIEPMLSNATDQRNSTSNPLSHSFLNLITNVSILDQTDSRRPIKKNPSTNPNLNEEEEERPYLLTNLVVISTHEPCLCCSMALLHSRIHHLFYLLPVKGAGGCGSLWNLNNLNGLNHKFFVWKLKLDFKLPLIEFDP